MNKHLQEIFDVKVENLIYGGQAIGHLPDGRAVFIPYALPGEIARIEITEQKKKYAQSRLLEVIQASDERIAPRCIHFGICGGCHYQHLPYPAQLKYKKQILEEQLIRLAGIKNPPVIEVVASPEIWNYRNSIQFHLDMNGKPGFQMAGSNEIVAIGECHLPVASINSTWPCLDIQPDSEIDRIELRSGIDDEILLILEGKEDGLPPEFEVSLPISTVHLGTEGTTLLSGDGFLVMQVKERYFRVSPSSFFQVNSKQAEKIIEHLLTYLKIDKTTTVWDVYCGVGLFSAFLAGSAARCIGIEVVPEAVGDFAVNLNEFENVDIYVGPAEEIAANLEVDAQIVIVDPPRAGLDTKVLRTLVGKNPNTIVYVSCDPSTLARDSKQFISAGYHLERITLFDMFPQTFHIESVSIFSR